MQLRHATALTSDAYVTQQGWLQASLDACPLHAAGGCGLRRLGTYRRVQPAGMRVARWYCALGQTTFSLLPDCLAAQLSDDLDEVERVVAVVEASTSVEAAADVLRPDIELPGAIRWVRRRLGPVRAALVALVTLMPELAGCPPTLDALSSQLGIPVLRQVRAYADKHIGSLPAPVGFGHRPKRGAAARPRREHGPGPDRPP